MVAGYVQMYDDALYIHCLLKGALKRKVHLHLYIGIIASAPLFYHQFTIHIGAND